MNRPTISVIIVNERGGEALAATLGCLANQRLPQGIDFEVVVVDCGESSEVEVRDWPYLCRQVSQPRCLFGYSQRAAAYNRGMEVAAGEFILLLAEGLVVEEDFLADHWAYHAVDERLCVLGALPGRQWEQSWLREVVPWALVDGANLSVRRCEMEQAGGYDVAYGSYEAGDADLGYRLWKAGVKILFSSAASARWVDPLVEPGTWRGRGLDYLGYKHPEVGTVTGLWQLEADVEARNGLLHSDAYQRRVRALLKQSALDTDDPRGWTLVCFIVGEAGNVSEHFLREVESEWQESLQEVLLVDSRPSPPPGAAMATVQLATVPVIYRPFSRSHELAEVAYLQLAQRLAGSKVRTLATRDLLWGMDRDLIRWQQELRQVGLNWARVSARSSVALLWNNQKGMVWPQWQQLELPEKSRAANCLEGAWQQQVSLPKTGFSLESLAEGYSYPPRAISFKLTHSCNLRCEMCGQWGPLGNVFRQEKETLREQMTLSELQTVIDQVMPWRPGMIYLWGGEPFLHPDFLEFIAYIRCKGLYCLVTTNGTQLAETADELVARGLHTLRVSLDGPPEVHDRIRGRPGTFAQAVEGIRAVKKAKTSRDALWPLIEVFCTISPSNYCFLEALVEQLEPLGVDALNFGHMMHVPQEVGERHQRLFRQLFGVEAEAWRGFSQDVGGIDTGLLMEVVGRLHRRSTSFPIGFEPPLRSLAEIPLYYQDPSLLFPDKHCRGPWMWAEIHPNGDLSFCDEYPDYIVGNVLRDGFAEVWNGPQARLFRRQVLAHKRFPICTPCHLLHLGPSSQG